MLNLKELARGSTTYFIANVINAAVPFFLLPTLTRVLTTSEYGLVASFVTIISVLSAFSGLSLHGIVNIKYFDKKINHPCFAGNCLILFTTTTTIILIFIYFSSDYLIKVTKLSQDWILIAVLACLAQLISQIRLVLWQAKNKPVKYSIFQILQTTVNLTLSLILVIYLQMGWEGRASGIVITFISFGMIALYSLVRSRLVIFNINWSYIKIALRFGIPLIPHTIGGLLIVLGDRFIIAHFLGVDELGLYFVGIQVALVLSIAIDGFSKAYFPWLSAKLPTASQQEKKAIVHLTYKLFIGIIASATIYSFFVYHLFPLILGSNFVSIRPYVPWMIFSAAFMGMYTLVGIYIFHSKKTECLSLITITAGALHAVICYFMVEEYGLLGAVQASLLTSITTFLSIWIVSARVYQMPWFKRC